MNELQVFNNEEFGTVRTSEENGKVLFCGKDIAAALGYADSVNAIKQHCRGVAIHHPINDNLGRQQMARFIPEGDVYRLITHSKLPSAVRFESWVFDEVLPSLRQTGTYHLPQTYAEALRQLADTAEQKEKLLLENQVMKPKALFADAVECSHTSILVGDLAKLIKQNGVDIGQKRLFAWLRDNGYLMKHGNSKNMPTQTAMDKQLFEVKERTISNPDGSVRITKTTAVTGKGQIYFVNKFCAKGEAR